LLTQEGAALVRVLPSRIDPANNIFEGEAEWFNSYEAEQHCQHIEPISDSPVCWTLTGYASGHSTALFGREDFYYEKNVWEGETSDVLSSEFLRMTKSKKLEISRRCTKLRTLRASCRAS